jgi:methylenetetrahydrofolate reductase (NADPH)
MNVPLREATTLASRLERGSFVVTAELVPPLSASPDTLIERAQPLRGLVDAVNVTDAASARPAMASLAAAALLVREGFEPILQMTCRDRNRIALASDLVGAAALGVRNLLVLHGDDPKTGDMPEAKPVYDLDARSVMALARDMRDAGALPSGRDIEPPPHFLIGCADTPIDPPADWSPKALETKIAAGAQFAQTQFCFDPGITRRYFARLADAGITERLKFIVGLGPLLSAKQARFMDEKLFGVSIPAETIARLEGAADARAEGQTICAELIAAYREIPGIAGVHIMAPMQSTQAIAGVLERSGIKDRR